MKKSLLLLSTILFSLTTHAQTTSVLAIGATGGTFNNGAFFDEQHAARTGEQYSPEKSKFIAGITFPVYLHDYFRIETSFCGTRVTNKLAKIEKNELKVYSVEYGVANYQLTVAPAFLISLAPLHVYLGAELGWSLPDGSFVDGGSMVGGRGGFDLHLSKQVFISCGVGIGKITHTIIDNNSNNKNRFSYHRVQLGLNYKFKRTKDVKPNNG